MNKEISENREISELYDLINLMSIPDESGVSLYTPHSYEDKPQFVPNKIASNDQEFAIIYNRVFERKGFEDHVSYKEWLTGYVKALLAPLKTSPNLHVKLFEKTNQFIIWLGKYDDKPQKKIKGEIKFIEDAAKDKNALTLILSILIEADLIDADSKIFKDNSGGSKGHFYSTIESFHTKGYFSRKPSKVEYLAICKNSFGAEISESTARNSQTRAKGISTIPPFI